MSHRDPVDALHGVLLLLPGGIADAARSLGRSPGTLHNKFSDAMPHYEVTAREALALADYAKTTVYAEAVCEHFGGTFMAIPPGAPSEDDVLQAYLGIIQQMGELSKEFTEARADGIIEPTEFDALKLRAHRTVGAVMHMLNELEGMVRELPTPPQPAIRKVAG
jgi:hypothetical protein